VIAAHRVIQAGDPEVRLVGIGAAAGEEEVVELAVGGEELREPFSEADRGLRRNPAEALEVRRGRDRCAARGVGSPG
jgi:hypothetical protein